MPVLISMPHDNLDESLDWLIEMQEPEDYVSVKLKPEEEVLFILYRASGSWDMQIDVVPVQLIDGVAHYAFMSEQERPEEYLCCPKRLLDQSEVSDDSGWREACRKHQAA